ncbi:hypothetical protein ANN_23421, partial [Periplaneta americana]
LADALRKLKYTVYEEVHGTADNGSNRRIDIIAISESLSQDMIIDPTITFESYKGQPEDVHEEKRAIYVPTIPYYKDKYQLHDISVTGLMFGARGTIPNFSSKFCKTLGLHKSFLNELALLIIRNCETRTLTLREEQRLRVYQNKVLRKILAAKRDEGTGGRRKLHNTELLVLYSSPNIIRNIKSRSLGWVGHVGENPQTIRKKTEILLEASKGIGLEVKPEKTKYMIMSCDRNILRNGNIKIGDLSFEEVEKFKYLGGHSRSISDPDDHAGEVLISLPGGKTTATTKEACLSPGGLVFAQTTRGYRFRLFLTVHLDDSSRRLFNHQAFLPLRCGCSEGNSDHSHFGRDPASKAKVEVILNGG